MPRKTIERIRDKIRLGQYDMTAHAMEEMAGDQLDILDGEHPGTMMYGDRCEYCDGTVQPREVKREAFKHKDGFIILEDILIGVCDGCGNRYYSADILHAVHAVATGAISPQRKEEVPVAHLP